MAVRESVDSGKKTVRDSREMLEGSGSAKWQSASGGQTNGAGQWRPSPVPGSRPQRRRQWKLDLPVVLQQSIELVTRHPHHLSEESTGAAEEEQGVVAPPRLHTAMALPHDKASQGPARATIAIMGTTAAMLGSTQKFLVGR